MKKLITMCLTMAMCSGAAMPTYAVNSYVNYSKNNLQLSSVKAETNTINSINRTDKKRAAAISMPPGNSFFDVPDNAYYTDAVNWAVMHNITNGTNINYFNPHMDCTMGQAVTFLWRAVGSPKPTIENPFSNLSTDIYYKTAAIWAYEKGLISDTVFYGNQPCTQNDVITYIWKLSGQPKVKNTPTATQPWNLLLVNPWNRVPQGFTVKLTSVGGGHYVDSRCAGALKQMLADCRKAGLSPVVCSSYRTTKKQESLFNRQVAAYRAKGMPQAGARTEAARSVAVPGTSEHQIGLAVDIVDNHNQALDKSQESTAVQKWLMTHCREYGFILRYPNGKSDLTGIIYEPWHYRYVGKDAALAMYEQGICMEEYIQSIREYENAKTWAMEQGITSASTASQAHCTRAQMMSLLYEAFANRT